MLMSRVLALTLTLPSNQLTEAHAGPSRPLLVHVPQVNGPEVVFGNRYVGQVGFTIPGPCPQVGGIAYSDHYYYGPEGRVFLDGFTTCPLPPY